MAVFKVSVPTIDKDGCFYRDSDGDVNPCEGGVFFAMAETPAEVAALVPNLIHLERVGVGIYLSRSEDSAETDQDTEEVDEETLMARYIL